MGKLWYREVKYLAQFRTAWKCWDQSSVQAEPRGLCGGTGPDSADRKAGSSPGERCPNKARARPSSGMEATLHVEKSGPRGHRANPSNAKPQTRSPAHRHPCPRRRPPPHQGQPCGREAVGLFPSGPGKPRGPSARRRSQVCPSAT